MFSVSLQDNLIKQSYIYQQLQQTLNHLSMEAQFKLKFQIQEPYQHQKQQFPYINVLPKQPTSAYVQKSPVQLQAIKKTQKIPFPNIREVILMYILENKNVIDVQESEFLKQRLINFELNNFNHKANEIIDGLIKEKERLIKLKSVSQDYLQQRQLLLGAKFRLNMHAQFNGSHLTQQIAKLERQKKSTLTKFLSQGIKNESLQEHRKLAQNKFNHDIIELFQKSRPQLQTNSQKFLGKLKDIKKLQFYIEQFQKALIFVLSVNKVQNKRKQYGEERLLKEVLDTSIGLKIIQLQKLIDEEINNFYEWRINCKYEKTKNFDLQRLQKKSIMMYENIKEKVYGFIPDILAVLNKDKVNIKNKEKEIKQQYEKFIPGYFDAVQVNIFFKKQSKLNQIIQNQKILLSNHLRKNFGMMVHYNKSTLYVNSIQLNKSSITSSKPHSISSNKGYLKEIVSNKILFLQEAINFINNQYPDLYKEACSGSSGVIGKISKQIEYFKSNKEENSISTHLIEGCTRLLAIANRK